MLLFHLHLLGIYKDLVSIQMSTETEEESPVNEDEIVSENVKKDPSSTQLVTATRSLSSQKATAESTAPAAVEISKEEARALNRKMWALVLQYKLWMLVALLGALIFGCIFPLWGLILAKTQTLFYYTNTDRIRSSAANVATYFILLGTHLETPPTTHKWVALFYRYRLSCWWCSTIRWSGSSG